MPNDVAPNCVDLGAELSEATAARAASAYLAGYLIRPCKPSQLAKYWGLPDVDVAMAPFSILVPASAGPGRMFRLSTHLRNLAQGGMNRPSQEGAGGH
jgi:hypothetical protein